MSSVPAGFLPSAQVATAEKARVMANLGFAKTGIISSSGLPRPGSGEGMIQRTDTIGLRGEVFLRQSYIIQVLILKGWGQLFERIRYMVFGLELRLKHIHIIDSRRR